MAELDYAFLADYAAVEGGKLSAFGASFTKVLAQRLPAERQLFIAGRIRASTTDPVVRMKVAVELPDGSLRIEGDIEMLTKDQEPYVGDKIGLLFAVGLPIPLNKGVVTVEISVEERLSRVLKFEVIEAQ